MSRIYLDHAATSPLLPEAREAMEHGFAIWANPSSPHAEGRKAQAALEDARDRVKAALGWKGEVIFTSGASEAIALAMDRAKVDRKLISAVEHDAVFRAAPDAEILPLDCGRNLYGVDPALLSQALARPGRALVAIQTVNPETGHPILRDEKSNVENEMIAQAGGLLLADCSQSAGKRKLPDADLIVVSSHKLGGPVGAGALLVKDFAMLEPTGGHERGYRMGTENLPAILGFAAAIEQAKLMAWSTDFDDWLDFKDRMSDIGAELVGGENVNLHIYSFAAPTTRAQAMLINLDRMGFAVSVGSACSSGTLKRSRVLEAMGVSEDLAARAVRVSLGWNTTREELDRFAECWQALAR